MSLPWAILESLSPGTMLIVGVLAVLLFGERLPEVGRKLGKNLMDFKRSIRGLQDEFTSAAMSVTTSVETPKRREETFEDREEATAPKFVPPPRPTTPENPNS